MVPVLVLNLQIHRKIFKNLFFRCLKLNMYHCLVNLYQVCSNGRPGVEISPAAEFLGSKMKYTLKYSSQYLLGSSASNLIYCIAW